MCDCADCKAARKQLDAHHPRDPDWYLPNPFWLWGMGITPEAIAQKKFEVAPEGTRRAKAVGMRCPKHPKYKAKRQPSGTCKTCWEIWLLAEALEKRWERTFGKKKEKK